MGIWGRLVVVSVRTNKRNHHHHQRVSKKHWNRVLDSFLFVLILITAIKLASQGLGTTKNIKNDPQNLSLLLVVAGHNKNYQEQPRPCFRRRF
jgi:hypothetical protein